MNRLIVFLLFFVMVGATPIWADTTNSGATTNSQTNTSGSNTTISGGYSQEATTTYQSGSSSNRREGFTASILARATRCCWPPESSDG